jgi:hypothetical protein
MLEKNLKCVFRKLLFFSTHRKTLSMNFTDYLVKQSYRDDIVGDLGKDVSMDTNRPSSGIRAWKRYLHEHCACDGAYDALDKAWAEFKIAVALKLTRG